jgi:hypothetical protein
MAAVVIKEVAGTRAIITIINKIYMKQTKIVSNWPAPPVGLILTLAFDAKQMLTE